jgi:hypothetical protein
MAIKYTQGQNWITNDGSYGYGSVITFDADDLTPRQWDIYEDLDEDNKFFYLQAILNGDSTSDWEDN